MHALVTGGAGFIGSHLVEALLNRDYKVTVIDDFSSGSYKNLKHLDIRRGINIIAKDIRSDLREVFKNGNFDFVFHQAAWPRVQLSIKEPRETNDVNVNGTLNLLIHSRDFKIKRFIFASSSSVYGDQKVLPLHEKMTPTPISPYALHKLTGEHYCQLFARLYGLETVSLRYFNVYGPRQNPGGEYANLISKFIYLINSGTQPVIFGTGNHTRDFTYVSDVVAANVIAAETNNKKALNTVFNIGSGQNISVNTVVSEILKLSGGKVIPKHGPEVIEPKDTKADISKAKELLGWAPKVKFAEGIKSTHEFFCS